MSEVKIEVHPTGKELILRSGNALPLQEPKVYNFTGNIFAPVKFLRNWIDNRKYNEGFEAVLELNYKESSITLRTNPEDAYGHVIVGKTKLSDKIDKFRIMPYTKNEDFFIPVLLGRHLKKFERYLTNQEQATKLINDLQKFDAKITQNIAQHQKFDGNKKILYEQTMESALPDSFLVTMPVFDGENPYTFSVELLKDAKDTGVNLWLESIDLSKLLDEYTEKAFSEVENEFNGKVLILNL